MKPDIYLDNSATTKPYPEAVEAMVEMLQTHYGNPSSLHRKGLQAEREIDKARDRIAKALGGVKKTELLFTSGGTEANNLALFGAAYKYQSRGKHIITTQIEHACVFEAAEELQQRGYDVTFLPVDENGIVRVEDVKNAWRDDTILVSIMYVNNETGAIQPIQKIGAFLKDKRKTLFHVDAVQAFGKIPLKIKESNIDLLTVSSHKIHGPKGVGALYIRDGVQLSPLFYGGGQERNIRSGTENVAGIVGFGAAAEQSQREMREASARMAQLRDQLIEGLTANLEDIRINTPTQPGLAAPHIVNASFPGVRGEVLVHALETEGVFVSTGSACSSKDKIYSRVLQVTGLPEPELEGAIRFSLSSATTEEEIQTTVAVVQKTVADLRLLSRR
ncbi:cysteine desulfurase family protein [Tumebacillus flagellatus]|uniref:Cysteine desulfurase n=1 Tax=Tumebacillus flagellatus TaxID=1157490 RepID=A0A074M979_9BACL|nr:cysteine desulfurase family protein [Tumebacillus flagellatus]KEO82507.1 cysteine desulfurase [Tumebacillus flagellatus]